jgi:hypothetical protein
MKIPELAADASARVTLGCSCARECRRQHFIQESSGGRWPGMPTCLLDGGIAPTGPSEPGAGSREQGAGSRGRVCFGRDVRDVREGERGKRVWFGAEEPSMRRDWALRRAAADEGRARGRESLGALREGKWQVASARHPRVIFRVLGRPKSTPNRWMTGHGPWTSTSACSLPPRANLSRSCPPGPFPVRAQRGLIGAHVSRQFHGPWSVIHGPWSMVHGGYRVRAGRAKMRDRCRSDFASP